MHARLAPRRHRFAYRIFLFALDLDELAMLGSRLRLFSTGRRNVYRFLERDFLPTHEPVFNEPRGSSDAARAEGAGLKARVVAHLAPQGIDLTGGRVLLVALPRVFGYLFNPVSFYFCYDRHGTPVTALTEVTNTFREMKPYTLGPEHKVSTAEQGEKSPHDRGETFHRRVPKHFYVSPFSDVDVAFDFTLRTPGHRLSVQIDDYIGGERVLMSTLSGVRRPLTDARLAWFTFKYPLITLKVIGLIHWHALRLWWKKVPWFPKAARSADQRGLYRPHASLTGAASGLTATRPELVSPPSDA